MKSHLYNIPYILLGALIIMSPALFNGFPLVYSDTGTYINSGMKLIVPNDRPIMYGLFIRIISCSCSLWMVIFAQCVLMSYVLFCLFKLLIKSKRINYIFILSLIFLTSFTGIGWYAGQLMPDIFTPISILSLGLLVFYPKLKKTNIFLLSLILVFSLGTHFSNSILATLLLIFCFISLKHISSTPVRINYFILPVCLIITAILVIGTLNYSIEKKFKINKSGGIFLIGRLIDSGVLKSFLKEKCPTNNYVLCNCIDSLPTNNRDFLWSANSPLYKNGGWEHPSADYKRIFTDVLKSPKHCMMFIGNSVTSSLSQLFQNEIGSGLISTWYSAADSPPYSVIATHFLMN